MSSYRGGQISDEARKQSSRDITKRGGGAEEEEKGREGWRREQESRRKSREKEMRRWRKWEMWLRIALVETTKNARNISYHQLLFSAQETIFNVFFSIFLFKPLTMTIDMFSEEGPEAKMETPIEIHGGEAQTPSKKSCRNYSNVERAFVRLNWMAPFDDKC